MVESRVNMNNQSKSKWNGFSLKPRREVPEGLWMRCPSCEQMLYKSAVEKNLNVCPECNYHFRIEAKTRIEYLVDEGSFQQIMADMKAKDQLNFKFRETTYQQRLKEDEKKSGSKEAMQIGKAFIKGRASLPRGYGTEFSYGFDGLCSRREVLCRG